MLGGDAHQASQRVRAAEVRPEGRRRGRGHRAQPVQGEGWQPEDSREGARGSDPCRVGRLPPGGAGALPGAAHAGRVVRSAQWGGAGAQAPGSRPRTRRGPRGAANGQGGRQERDHQAEDRRGSPRRGDPADAAAGPPRVAGGAPGERRRRPAVHVGRWGDARPCRRRASAMPT